MAAAFIGLLLLEDGQDDLQGQALHLADKAAVTLLEAFVGSQLLPPDCVRDVKPVEDEGRLGIAA